MRHFSFLSETDCRRLFHRQPEEFGADSDVTRRAVALGATLYSPATRPKLADDLTMRAGQGLTSSVLCLEDSIADDEVEIAEKNLVTQLLTLAECEGPRPMVFVRVRAPEQIALIVDGLGAQAAVLSGFVFPKFTARSGPAFLDALANANASSGLGLMAMPVLESSELIHAETRVAELLAVRELLEQHRASVLALRIGTTDFASVYGLRRARDLSVYDVRILADVISDIVNMFGRFDGTGWIITGPVWEYLSGQERIFKPQLRETPFREHSEAALRARLIANDLDRFIREIALDKANGLTGKTVIHPTHVALVHALSVVTLEEYVDATDILGTKGVGGAAASAYGNKMNESKPHVAWASRVVTRAEIFGVSRPSTSFVDLLAAGLQS